MSAGSDDGLSTSVLLQYRLVGTSATVPPWTTLRTLISNDPNMETLHLDGSVEGVQFRVVQFEHGGGGCNCWAIFFGQIMVIIDDQQQTLGTGDFCLSSGLNDDCFCGTRANEARGTITAAFYFATNSTSSGEMCPGDSNSIIVSAHEQGPSLPQNCSTITPRM